MLVLINPRFSDMYINIGVGRFRILGEGGARFRILGAKGGQIPSRHMTS